ncbi:MULTISPECIES: rod-binding protein [unclassified Nitratiruptor]|uniref:rod-binding protein n=1 Tax=unclassified Nitratiruptor TaxID=2624044 RepID=UPI001915B4A9|nr:MULTISPECIES: rod-binding protein [unclassified Nitratiruptor]BCD59914.1 flagellar protein FlgJ [Nitratiruptor sp. YY08-10]BCD63837.1 flagellar protein FlgJ [Nitratiruptor sp. YY08-14]
MKIETYWDFAQLSQIKTKDLAAKGFEEEFIRQFLKEVRKSLERTSPLLDNSFSAKMYWDMFDMQIAKVLSDSDQFGLKEYIAHAVETYKKNSQ